MHTISVYNIPIPSKQDLISTDAGTTQSKIFMLDTLRRRVCAPTSELNQGRRQVQQVVEKTYCSRLRPYISWVAQHHVLCIRQLLANTSSNIQDRKVLVIACNDMFRQRVHRYQSSEQLQVDRSGIVSVSCERYAACRDWNEMNNATDIMDPVCVARHVQYHTNIPLVTVLLSHEFRVGARQIDNFYRYRLQMSFQTSKLKHGKVFMTDKSHLADTVKLPSPNTNTNTSHKKSQLDTNSNSPII